MVNIIVAVGNYVVGKGFPMGKNGGMPWNNKSDLKWFKDMTTGHPVIMGRKTFEAIGHPLPKRLNIVVSSDPTYQVMDGIHGFSNLEMAIDYAKLHSDENSINGDVFIIGGASIYKYALDHDLVDRVYIDLLAEDAKDADTFFPDIIGDKEWEEVGRPIEIEPRKAYATQFVKIRGKENHVDEQYLNLVNRIIKEGNEKDTRAGKTRSIFGVQMRFNLKEGLPMLTTKKMFSKGVIHELLWFLRGDTNIKYLVDNGVHIWDDDAYRYYLEVLKACKGPEGFENAYDKETFLEFVKLNSFGDGLYNMDRLSRYHYGDLGPVYGHQWRNWNGVDQIKEVIEKLRNNPDDRRIMISAWNVGEIKGMALPPCHYCCQFYTKKLPNGKRELSCMWNQRSVDCGLGLSFNILSYAILTHMVAQCCDMEVGELIFSGGDVHVYENHIEPLKEQLTRNPHMYALPTLKLNPTITEIDNFTYEDIKIEGYKSYPTIKMPLSVGL